MLTGEEEQSGQATQEEDEPRNRIRLRDGTGEARRLWVQIQTEVLCPDSLRLIHVESQTQGDFRFSKDGIRELAAEQPAELRWHLPQTGKLCLPDCAMPSLILPRQGTADTR